MVVNQTCCCKCNKISGTYQTRRFVRRSLYYVSRSTIENTYTPGAGVGARNRFVRKALYRRAYSTKVC